MLSKFSTFRFWQSAFVLMIVIFVAYLSTTLDFFARDYDEGMYLAQAQLVQEGYDIYEDIRSAIPPLFIWQTVAIFELVGQSSIFAVRFMMILWAAAGLIALAWIGRRVAQPSQKEETAFFAALLLILLPLWTIYSQIGMPDIPSISLSLIGLAVALMGWEGEQARSRFFWGGVIAGLALMMKQIAVYVAPVLALIVVLSYRSERPFYIQRFVLDGLATLIGYFLPLVAILPFLRLQAAYDVVFYFHWEVGERWFSPLASLQFIALFALAHLIWILLAFFGLISLSRRRAWKEIAFLLGWLALVVLMLSQHSPVWGHHLLTLAPPLVLLAALAVVEGLAIFKRREGFPILPLLLLLFFIGLWPYALQAGQAFSGISTDVEHSWQETVEFLQYNVPSDEMLLTDDLMLAVSANRLVIPYMSETSFKKITSGFLTSSDLITATIEERPAAIIFWTGRFDRLPEWREWVEEHYEVGLELSPEQMVFIRPDLVQ